MRGSTEWARHTVESMRRECRERGLPHDGVRPVLVDRLRGDDGRRAQRAQADASAAQPAAETASRCSGVMQSDDWAERTARREAAAVQRLRGLPVAARPLEPQTEPAPACFGVAGGVELATEPQTLLMASLSSRHGELLPSNFHRASGEPALTMAQASAWLDDVFSRHPRTRRSVGARLLGEAQRPGR